jgi:lipopolysaccharide biosynthesis protein
MRLIGPLARRILGADRIERTRRYVRRLLIPSAVTKVPFTILKRPGDPAAKQVCLYVCTALEGGLRAHALRAMESWSNEGFEVIAVVVVNRLSDFREIARLPFCSGVIVRENHGVDFGAWAMALHAFPELKTANLLAMANDSVVGPLHRLMPRFLDRLAETKGDVVGVVESPEMRRHFQSWLIFYRASALRSEVFRSFWSSVRNLDREDSIDQYETRLVSIMERGQLECAAMYGPQTGLPGRSDNLMLSWPLRLVANDCCFAKVKLFTQNPHDLPVGELHEVFGVFADELAAIDCLALRRESGRR